MAEVRTAVPEDADAAIAILADAFFDDPLSVWIAPDPVTRRRFHRNIFRAAFDDSLDAGTLQVAVADGSLAGVAVWYPPGRAANPGDPGLSRAREALSGDDLERLAALREGMAEHHPAEPHYYLWLVGVSRSHQGAGIGGALLDATLAAADRTQEAAYLEATAKANRRLYERYGFEVAGEIHLPQGPTIWPMWRTPRRVGRKP